MRVISGSFKGKRLYGSNDYKIRPTTDKVKESIFNIVREFISEREVMDLFCGSGSLGIEALSRGAKKVTFVEKSSSSIALLKKNIYHLQLVTSAYQIIQRDVLHYCADTHNSYDVILADPPFEYPPLPELVRMIITRSVLRENGVLIIEHETTNPIESSTSCYNVIQQKKFGRSLISFIVRNDHGQ
jgi:16S rRNA (guanine(966)-N(2))-methyltransferase RsmD